MAALHPGTTWRVILTDPGGVALAVERVRRRSRSAAGAECGVGPQNAHGEGSGRAQASGRAETNDQADTNGQAEARGRAETNGLGETSRTGSNPASGPWPPGIVGRVTVVLPLSTFDDVQASGRPSPGSSTAGTGDSRGRVADGGIRAAIWRAALRAARRARPAAGQDAGPAGPCAHAGGSARYRPTTLIREYVEARDRTCRQPTCGQPAWRTDLDHTRPWDQGGPTCPCNLGSRCRTHHKIKQLPGWALAQPEPGTFHLTTPAGRTYITRPDAYPA